MDISEVARKVLWALSDLHTGGEELLVAPLANCFDLAVQVGEVQVNGPYGYANATSSFCRGE